MRIYITLLLAIMIMEPFFSGAQSTTVIHPVKVSSLKNAATKWERAIESKDIDGIVVAFAPDAIIMYPHPLPITNSQANRAAWQKVYEDSVFEHPITVDRVEVARSDDMGYTFGRFWGRNQKTNYNDGGRYLAVWKKLKGEWKIVLLATNPHEDIKADRTTK